MSKRIALALAALTATAVLAAGLGGAASANRLEVSSQNVRFTWAPLTIRYGERILRCNVTLEGSFHSRVIAKVAGGLIGYITRASVGHPCSGEGEAWVLNGVEAPEGVVTTNSLPWHIQYVGFTGLLPEITQVRIYVINFGLYERINLVGSTCLYKSTATRPFNALLQRERAGAITAIRVDEASLIPLSSGGIACLTEEQLSGAGLVAPGGTERSLLVTLVA